MRSLLLIYFSVIHLAFSSPLLGQLKADFPSIGAQVFIEPGQSQEQIEQWFSLLEDHGFTSCRIRMFESYMKDENGHWDFRLFDAAFDAAAKYDIKVFATVFPATSFTDVGGIKLPHDSEHEQQIATYIEAMVRHYRDHPALHQWVLINEPGLGYLPQTPYVQSALEAWKDTVLTEAPASQEYRKYTFDEQRFLKDLNSHFLKWVATEIRKSDSKTLLHVNNHQIFQLADEYDFPKWMTFLNSLGASIHPSWHFRYFERSNYTLAAAANCDIINSGAGDKPFWVTELQGGSNSFSGYDPITPTTEEITQWLWASIGSGAEGIIFWSLNARQVGIEAGEWALLTNQQRPTGRLIAAEQVVRTMAEYPRIFEGMRPLPAKVHLLYTRESLWAEKTLHVEPSTYEGRNWGAGMKSMMSYYKAFHELGIGADIAEAGEFDWSNNDYSGSVMVVANQIAISNSDWERLKRFVERGGSLILSGLSGHYDEHLSNRFAIAGSTDFLGAELSEIKVVSDTFGLSFANSRLTGHLWRGELTPSDEDHTVYHHTQEFGKGSAVWLPSLIGLGDLLVDRQQLSNWLLKQSADWNIGSVSLKNAYPGLVTRHLRTADGFLTIFINKAPQQQTLALELDPNFEINYRPRVIVGEESLSIVEQQELSINPEQTIVVAWERKH